jgi:hypothetical protein
MDPGPTGDKQCGVLFGGVQRATVRSFRQEHSYLSVEKAPEYYCLLFHNVENRGEAILFDRLR